MKSLIVASILVLPYFFAGGAAPGADAAEPLALKIDAVHTSAIFQVVHAGVGRFYGRFDQTTGSIELDPDDPEGGKVEIVVDVESVHTGDEKRDAHLKRADFFDSAQFPSIEFTSTKIAKGAKDGWFEVTGDLQMRGASKEITIPVEYVGAGEFMGSMRYGFAATFTIDRSDWGVSYGIDGPLSDEVQLIFGIEAVPAKSE